MTAEQSMKNILSYDCADINVGDMKDECATIDVEDYYRTYGPMVLRRCRSILRDEDAAFDAMQEVFVKLMKSADRLKGDFPSSLLYRMATNTCLNMIRDKRSISVSPDDLIITAIAGHDDSQERFVLGDFIDFVFKNEHSSTREMAVMHYVDGLTYEEVSESTGLSVSGVRKRLRTFKEKIQHLRGEAL
jgi:RNA polymerase sigma-70 factor, ECF subfamily